MKLTKKICAKNDLERIPASKFIDISQNDLNEKWEIKLVTNDLKVVKIELDSLNFEVIADLDEIMPKSKKYDKVFNLAKF